MIMSKQELINLLEVLISELDRDITKPGFYRYHKDEFQQLSHEKSAMEILIKRLQVSTSGAYATVEKFCDEMNRYSLVNKKTSRMFSAAYDAAMNVLDVVIREESYEH